MGKPTGFMEYDRELPEERPPAERIYDWLEFHFTFLRKGCVLRVLVVWIVAYHSATLESY